MKQTFHIWDITISCRKRPQRKGQVVIISSVKFEMQKLKLSEDKKRGLNYEQA